MLGNIFFVGGIHGVGKSTICRSICEHTNLQYLSASELIKWKDINTDVFNKKVVNIPETQDRLINGLIRTIQAGKNYLLDGHYCLLDNNSLITSVPVEIFKLMQPASLHIILGDVIEINERLEARDSKTYDANLLEQMQQNELLHAKHLSSLLRVELSIGTQADYSEIINAINGSTFYEDLT